MNDHELLRYSRQIMLPEIGIEGQKKLLKSTVLIVGVGGLGSPTALYLAASGVGHIILSDSDIVEESNIQRQIIYETTDIGFKKAAQATKKLRKLNPNITITTYPMLTRENVDSAVSQADIVLDGTDRFSSRFTINKACIKNKVPLVSAAVIKMEGQVSVFKGYLDSMPCYRCLYPEDTTEDFRCVENGILSPVAGIIGSIQALQAIKVITNVGDQLIGKLLVVDAKSLSFNKIKLSKNPKCPTCSA